MRICFITTWCDDAYCDCEKRIYNYVTVINLTGLFIYLFAAVGNLNPGLWRPT